MKLGDQASARKARNLGEPIPRTSPSPPPRVRRDQLGQGDPHAGVDLDRVGVDVALGEVGQPAAPEQLGQQRHALVDPVVDGRRVEELVAHLGGEVGRGLPQQHAHHGPRPGLPQPQLAQRAQPAGDVAVAGELALVAGGQGDAGREGEGQLLAGAEAADLVFRLQPQVPGAGARQGVAAGHPHLGEVLAVLEHGHRQGEPELQPIGDADGGRQLAGDLVAHHLDAGLHLVFALDGVEREGVALVAGAEGQRELQVAGHLGGVEREVGLRPDGGLPELDLERAIGARRLAPARRRAAQRDQQRAGQRAPPGKRSQPE